MHTRTEYSNLHVYRSCTRTDLYIHIIHSHAEPGLGYIWRNCHSTVEHRHTMIWMCNMHTNTHPHTPTHTNTQTHTRTHTHTQQTHTLSLSLSHTHVQLGGCILAHSLCHTHRRLDSIHMVGHPTKQDRMAKRCMKRVMHHMNTHTLQHTATHCNTHTYGGAPKPYTLHKGTASRKGQMMPYQWGFYRNVIPMRWDCGKNPILNSVYLTGSHSIFPSQWPSSQIAMGPQRFNWSGPPPRT